MAPIFGRRSMDLPPVVILGLGRFGQALAGELTAHGVEVLGIDRTERAVNECADEVTTSAVADSTDIEVLRQLGVENVDRAVVAIGSNLEASILTTSNLIELGVKDVWAKADSEAHARILQRLGVQHVVRPEFDTGKRVAHLLGGQFQEFAQFDERYGMSLASPNKVLLAGPLNRRDLYEEYKIDVVAIKSMGSEWVPATNGREIEPTDMVIVAGSPERLDAFAKRK